MDNNEHGANLADVGTDCISREAAMDALNEYFDRIGKLKRRGLNKGEKAIRLDTVGTINSLPSAEPQIVRCKDCKHWIPYDWMFSEMWQSKNIADYPEDDIGCALSDMAMKANDFCSRAERREVTT